MPGISRRGPFARPSMPLRVLADPRAYRTALTGGSSEGFTTLAEPGTSVYDEVIRRTPGLVNWWPLDRVETGLPSATNGYRPAAGATTLSISGTVNSVVGLLPGSRGRAAQCVSSGSGFLHALDYWPWTGTDEIATFELWVEFGAFAADSAVLSQRSGGGGWTIGCGGSGGQLYYTLNAQQMDAGSILALNRLYHIVVVVGGTQSDHRSRIYVNAKQVASLFFTNVATLAPATTFEVGHYPGGGYFNATYQHVAIYSRMLQPTEVLQHYQAAFARG